MSRVVVPLLFPREIAEIVVLAMVLLVGAAVCMFQYADCMAMVVVALLLHPPLLMV